MFVSLLLLIVSALLAWLALPHIHEGTDEYRIGFGMIGAAAACAARAFRLTVPALIFLALSAIAFFPPWIGLSETATAVFYGVLGLALGGAASIRGLRGPDRRRRIRFVGVSLIAACLIAASIGGASAGRGIGMAILFALAFALIARKKIEPAPIKE
jgi:hypothetical protein